MSKGYSRPHLSFNQQVSLLERRGLQISDHNKANKWLSQIGYQRLKPYWFSLRKISAANGRRLESFESGAKLADVVNLYIADKKLRLTFMDALERIEVSVRVQVSHTLGKRDMAAHRSTKHLDPSRSSKIELNQRQTRHRRWLGGADRSERRSKSDWVKEFIQKYGRPLPIWMAVETWDFGTLSHLYEISHPSDRKKIAAAYGVPNPEVFASWLRCLATVRNVCAHHGRLWNEPLVNQPKLPSASAVPELSHIKASSLPHTRLYAAAAITQYILNHINPTSKWHDRLAASLTDLAKNPRVSLLQMGFDPNWKRRLLWRKLG